MRKKGKFFTATKEEQAKKEKVGREGLGSKFLPNGVYITVRFRERTLSVTKQTVHWQCRRDIKGAKKRTK